MKLNPSSILSWWKKNFGRGIYAGVIFGLVCMIMQFGAMIIGVAALMLFPMLDLPENETPRNILAVFGFVLIGIPLFGFLFTYMYEREEGVLDESQDDKSNPANKQNKPNKSQHPTASS